MERVLRKLLQIFQDLIHPWRSNRNWILEEDQNSVMNESDFQNICLMSHREKRIFDRMMNACDSSEPSHFFIDGPGGSGTTHVYKSLLASIRSFGRIAMACAGSCK